MIKHLEMDLQFEDDHTDDHVDEEIKRCLSLDNPKNFFVFAGAGSGKTRSLVNALMYLDKEMGEKLAANSKQIAVITYTNAASDEISRRLQYKSIFSVSTIHSFLWELIRNFQTDIKQWVIQSLEQDISELQEQEKECRRSSKKRVEDIIRKTERLNKLSMVNRFTYNPNGDNIGSDSLNHSEVVAMGSDFILKEETMQNIVTSKYPILLIDESQDTKKELVDALFAVCKKHKDKFIVGMFGDTMQRIYMDGKEDLAKCIPDEWEKPEKVMNHRSASRIVELANTVRGTVDGQCQRARSDSTKGTVCLFITKSSADKEKIEKQVSCIMSRETGDSKWENEEEYKSLILEHHMAATRFRFQNLFSPQNKLKQFNTSLRDGSIAEFSFLSNVILPLVIAYQGGKDFEVSKIIRKYSPLLDRKKFLEVKEDQTQLLQKAESAVDSLMELWSNENVPACIDIIRLVCETGLFSFDSRVDDILAGFTEGEHPKITALREVLSVSFDELVRYSKYVNDETQFATHQGIKGLEFPRVMVIMDDKEARGFLFSYEKLFGAKERSDADIKNENEGKDTSITRTTRLFYVACTRAEKSLAVVAYTENPALVKQTAIENGWFLEDEVHIL